MNPLKSFSHKFHSQENKIWKSFPLNPHTVLLSRCSRCRCDVEREQLLYLNECKNDNVRIYMRDEQ